MNPNSKIVRSALIAACAVAALQQKEKTVPTHITPAQARAATESLHIAACDGNLEHPGYVSDLAYLTTFIQQYEEMEADLLKSLWSYFKQIDPDEPDLLPGGYVFPRIYADHILDNEIGIDGRIDLEDLARHLSRRAAAATKGE